MKTVLTSALLACTLAIATAGAYAQGTASPTGTPPPTPSATASPDPAADAVMARAKEWLHRFQTGDIDRAQLSAKMDAAMTPAVIKQTADGLGALGDPTSFAFVKKVAIAGDNTAYVYRVAFAMGTFNEVFVLDAAGKVSGFTLPPAQ